MIVIGVDVHKRSVTAVAVDEAGRLLGERIVQVASDELLASAASLAEEGLWALEDGRRLPRWLERQLLAAAEELVRVPRKLMAPERRARGAAASRIQSMRSRSRGPLCANRCASSSRP